MSEKKEKKLLLIDWKLVLKIIFKSLGGIVVYVVLPLSICAIFANYLWEIYVEKVGNPFDFKILWSGDTPRTALGAFGDFMGGLLNPLFAFMSFIGVLWTLKMSREELSETRRVMDGQLSTQLRQQFDSNFYELFSQLNKLQDQLLTDRKREILNILASKNKKSLESTRATILTDRFISRYFMLLYQILKMINQKVDSFPSQHKTNSNSWKKEKESDKKFYTNLLRSQQDIKILQLLFINCYKGFSEYKKYLKDAEFFEHMNFYELSRTSYNFKLLLALKFYIEENDLSEDLIIYFGKSSYIKLLKDNLLRKALFSSNIKDIDQFSYQGAYLRLIECIFEISRKRQINCGDHYIRLQGFKPELERIDFLVVVGDKKDDFDFKGGQYFFQFISAFINENFTLEVNLQSNNDEHQESIKQIKMTYLDNKVQVNIRKNDGSSIMFFYK